MTCSTSCATSTGSPSRLAEERPVQRPDLSEAAVFDYPPKAMREFFMNARHPPKL